MRRWALAEGCRTVKGRDHRPKSSRARTMTARVDRPMGSASRRSTTTASPSSAKARASARHSAGSVEGPCSPRSRTTVRLAPGPFPRPAPVCRQWQTKDWRGPWLSPTSGRWDRATRVWSTAPGRRMPARHFGAFVVPPSPYTPRRAGARGVGTPACVSPRPPGARGANGPSGQPSLTAC